MATAPAPKPVKDLFDGQSTTKKDYKKDWKEDTKKDWK